MEFKAPAGSIAWTTDPKRMRELTRDKNFIVGQLARRRSDPAWVQYTHLRFFAVDPEFETSPLFLGTLQNLAGEKSLVAIYLHSQIVQRPRYFYLFPRAELLNRWFEGGTYPDFQWVTYYQGTIDPADTSRFTIPYESDQGPGRILGHMHESSTVTIEWN